MSGDMRRSTKRPGPPRLSYKERAEGLMTIMDANGQQMMPAAHETPEFIHVVWRTPVTPRPAQRTASFPHHQTNTISMS